MDKKGIETIITTLKGYSAAAFEALGYLETYDYSDEARKWDYSQQPTVIAVEHPTLYNLYISLAYYLGPITFKENNLQPDQHLSRLNMEAAINYFQVSQDTLLAAKFNRIPIEPMLNVVKAFEYLNLRKEANRLRNVYEFALGIRRWQNAVKNGNGATIEIILELNYDEAPQDLLAEDEGYNTFAGLFKKSCNYATSQKKALYKYLKELYTTIDVKKADKTVMAVILLFRQPRTKYRQPFGTKNITTCKERAMDAFGRDIKVIKSYSENSLSGGPKLGDEHVKRAEDIIAKALEFTR